MNGSNLFIEEQELPKPLKKIEVYELMKKYKNGDKSARDKLIYHNIRLVIYEVNGKFNTSNYDLQELVGVGNIGLIKAVDTFDISKGVEFATYAIRCIDNEIFMFLRKQKKEPYTVSLNMPVSVDSDGNQQLLCDIIMDDIDIEENYIDKEIKLIIRDIVQEMQGRDRQIIMLYFGFYNNKKLSQKEIASKFEITQSYVSRIIRNLVSKLSKELQKRGIYGENFDNVKSDTNQKMESTGKKLHSIYEYLRNYSKAQIDEVISELTDEERKLIEIRYGKDLENPTTDGAWNKEYQQKFYGSLVPKMKRRLKKMKVKGGYRKQDIGLGVNKSTIDQVSQINMFNDKKEVVQEEMTKEVYTKILELLKTPAFSSLLNKLDAKEAMIVSLKLGYVDGKSFSNAAIAKFLEMDKQEVIEIITKVLLNYKDKLNQFLDEFIKNRMQDFEETDNKCSYTLKN